MAIHQLAPLLLEQGAGTADDKCASLCRSASRVRPRFKDVDYLELDKRGGSALFSADLDLMLEVCEGHAAYIGSAPSLMRSRHLTEDRSLRFQLQTGWQQRRSPHIPPRRRGPHGGLAVVRGICKRSTDW
jgi:hypothetical protein